jgi:hypothetical protein
MLAAFASLSAAVWQSTRLFNAFSYFTAILVRFSSNVKPFYAFFPQQYLYFLPEPHGLTFVA